jgi:fatty acid desaturase
MTMALLVPAAAPTFVTLIGVTISVPNLIVIVTMITVFVLALVLPFPKDHHSRDES